MKLFARLDRSAIKDFTVKRVLSFGNTKPVHFIQAGFGINQSGFYTVYFDTSAGPGQDGLWTSTLEDERNLLSRPLWRIYVDENAQAARLVRMIKGVFFELREAGVFENLLLAPNCDFGIEEFDGIDGWPSFEDRKKDNLVQLNL